MCKSWWPVYIQHRCRGRATYLYAGRLARVRKDAIEKTLDGEDGHQKGSFRHGIDPRTSKDWPQRSAHKNFTVALFF